MSDPWHPSPLPSRSLAELHQSLGASMMVLPQGDLELPAHYGSVDSEYGVLRSGCGLLDRSWVARLELTGEDRRRYLNGLVTCDVGQLAEGEGTYGFFTGPKGHLLADVVIRAVPEALWLELPAGKGRGIADHLRKFVVIDRVEVSASEETLPLTLLGAEATGRLRDLIASAELPEMPWQHTGCEILGHRVRVSADERWGVAAWTMWIRASEAPRLMEQILAADIAKAVGYQAVDLLRIEEGIAWFGRDFGADQLPQETGIEEAVSYDKGCYLGQEVVARLHFRGQVSRMLRGLEFERAAPPPRRTALLYEGREAGLVTSAACLPDSARVVGIGLVQRRAMTPGTRVQVAGGGEAVVRALPTEPPRRVA